MNGNRINLNKINIILFLIIIVLFLYGIIITVHNATNSNILESKRELLDRVSKIEQLEENWRTQEANINIKRNEVYNKKQELNILEQQLDLMIKDKKELENIIHGLRGNVLTGKTEDVK